MRATTTWLPTARRCVCAVGCARVCACAPDGDCAWTQAPIVGGSNECLELVASGHAVIGTLLQVPHVQFINKVFVRHLVSCLEPTRIHLVSCLEPTRIELCLLDCFFTGMLRRQWSGAPGSRSSSTSATPARWRTGTIRRTGPATASCAPARAAATRLMHPCMQLFAGSGERPVVHGPRVVREPLCEWG